MSNKADGFRRAITSGEDLDTFFEWGSYYITAVASSGVSHVPSEIALHLYVMRADNLDAYKRTVQIAVASSIGSNDLWMRRHNDSGWGDWKLISTATPLQEYALPLAEGFTQLRDCTYCKTQESMVHIELSVKGNITQGSEVLIATLPQGFRPKRPVRPVAHSHYSPFASGAALIYTDGRIAVIFSSAQTNCNLVCDFLAAN